MKLTLRIWRQEDSSDQGGFKSYELDDLHPDMSFLEALDILNQHLLTVKTEEPVAFDYDCREGICGMCSLVINGRPHGSLKVCGTNQVNQATAQRGGSKGVTTCQLHLRSFADGDEITIEPWRARAFPVIKDLIVDRSAFDRIMARGGYVSVNTGSAPDAHAIPISKSAASQAFDAAACIGCGACVAACKNSSAMLFVGAKVAHLAALKQGQVERNERVLRMMTAHDQEGFGACSQTKSCEAVCPKNISADHITQLNKEYLIAALKSPTQVGDS